MLPIAHRQCYLPDKEFRYLQDRSSLLHNGAFLHRVCGVFCVKLPCIFAMRIGLYHLQKSDLFEAWRKVSEDS